MPRQASADIERRLDSVPTSEDFGHLVLREQAGARTSAALTGTETILVVEDDARICALLKRGLETLGYHIHTAGSSADALEAYASHAGDIDIILCDVILPGMPGPDILEHIGRQHPASSVPPVVYMSGYSAHSLVEAGRLDPNSHFIQKPVLRATVAKAVREVLDA